MKGEKKAKAVIVGGSIAGVSCAHALISAGWEVVVLEKSAGPPQGSPTGAGLSLDSLALRIINSWTQQPELLQQASLPLQILQNRAIDGIKKVPRTLTREENLNLIVTHWADLHGVLYNALPTDIFLWGHMFLSFNVAPDKTSVTVQAKALRTDEIIEINGNLLVAADGWFSSILQSCLPDLKPRYSGYCAWRGVIDFSENENSELVLSVRKAYPELGRGLYFDLTTGSHTVFYELPGKRFNWIWFVNQPRPATEGTSVTMKPTIDMIEDMHQEAERVWLPEFARVIKETKGPFLNFINGCEPPEQIFWDNVVLVGDAAHPITPHGARSTSMCLLDAAVLGKCLQKWGKENLASALEEYQSIRLPVTSKQVRFSWRVGQMYQGFSVPDWKPFDAKTASPEDCEELKHRSIPFISVVPFIIG